MEGRHNNWGTKADATIFLSDVGRMFEIRQFEVNKEAEILQDFIDRSKSRGSGVSHSVNGGGGSILKSNGGWSERVVESKGVSHASQDTETVRNSGIVSQCC